MQQGTAVRPHRETAGYESAWRTGFPEAVNNKAGVGPDLVDRVVVDGPKQARHHKTDDP